MLLDRLCSLQGGVQLPVHEGVDEEGHHTHEHEHKGEEHGGGKVVRFCQGERNPESEGGTETGNGHLHPHSEGHLFALKPLHHRLGDGDSCGLCAHAENPKADHGDKDLGLHAEHRGIRTKVMDEGPVVDTGPEGHKTSGEESREADPHLVQDDPAEDEHHQKDVEDGVGGGVGTKICTVPPQDALQHGFERREGVVEEVGAKHGHRYDDQGSPPRLFGISQGCNSFCHIVGTPRAVAANTNQWSQDLVTVGHSRA